MTAEQIADVVMTAVKYATAPLVEQIADLKAKSLIVGPQGNAGPAGEKGAPGQDADPALVLELKAEIAELRGDLLQSVNVPMMLKQMVADAFAAMPKPVDGKDGTSITVDDVLPLIHSEVQKSVGAMPPAKDGVGIKTAVVDRSGHFVLTFSDGVEKDLGSVVGEDGKPGLPGAPGRWGDKGEPGTNGVDGLGFDDIQVLHDGERGFTFQFAKGERVKNCGAFQIPAEIYRGVYVDGKTYECGDGATWGGSEWHCNETTTSKPGDGSKAWTLKVKRGRDGKDGRDLAPAAIPVVRR